MTSMKSSVFLYTSLTPRVGSTSGFHLTSRGWPVQEVPAYSPSFPTMACQVICMDFRVTVAVPKAKLSR